MIPLLRAAIFSSLVIPTAFAQNPIIDVHVHAFGYDEYGYPPPPNEITGNVPKADSDTAAINATVAVMEEHNIVLGIASGPLDHVLQWTSNYPEMFWGGAYAGSRTWLPEPDRLRQLFESDSLKVLGELGLQYRGLAPTDSSVASYLALAEEYGVPLALHTGLGDSGMPYYDCCRNFRVRLGHPSLVEEVLIQYPNLDVYLMHAGYPFLSETKALLYIYPQLYVDIAVINWALPREEFHNYLRELVTAGFGDRIMFGSDQMVWPEAIRMAVDAVNTATFLTAQQKRDIFYNNAARFFQLPDDLISLHHAGME